MKLLIFVTSILALTQSTIWAQEFCSGTTCMPKEVQNECTTMQSNGCIDWSNGVVYATGMGVPNPNFKTQAQRTYSAYEASKTVAMRNLLQMVEGINISSSKTVKAGMLENDTINTQISGRIRNVVEAGKPKTMSDGSIWVTMKMYLRDIVSILVNNQQFERQDDDLGQKPVPEKFVKDSSDNQGIEYGGKPDVIYTGLIIDARGTGVAPAMSPKVYNAEGKEIYGSIAVERDFVLQHGIAGYIKGIDKSQQHERVKGNPLIIKATGSQKSTDLFITNEDAALLKVLDATQTFMREARVLIII
ncbi:MAG: hypothetical protein HQ517_03115 [SAR324 cluster bacterium]|nr:hypothetical protein [SAR324 cluster bacterium]